MILASEKQILSYTELGCWGTKTLIQDFFENATKSPDQTALADPLNKEALLGVPPHRITYAKLARAVDNTASALMAAGIGKDQIVLVQLPNCWELAMLYIAIAKIGAIISPVPLQWRAKELTYAAELTCAAAFITVETRGDFNHLAMGKKIQETLSSLKHIFSYEALLGMIESPRDPGLYSVSLRSEEHTS